MTAPSGIRIPITADGRGFDAELTRVVIAAMRNVQIRLDAQPLNIGINVDLDADAATAHMRTLREQLEREAKPITQEINVRVNLDRAGTPEELRALREELQREARPIVQQVRVQTDRTGITTPNVDSSSTSSVERLARSADSAGMSFSKLSGSIGSVAATAGKLGLVTAAVAGIGGAASAAAGLVGGLVGALAAVGPAAGAIAATAVVGLHGLADAFKAASTLSDNGPKEAAAQTKAVAAAQDQLANAADSVQSAQRSLASAQKDATVAAKAVGDAYKQAGRDLEDAQLRARGATISQKEAAIDLREATKEANDTVFDPSAHEQALVRLERAQLNYDQAVESNKRATEDATTAQAKGIEGSDAVVSAKDRQQAAEDRVTDAQRTAAKAAADVAKAAQAVSDAQNQATPSAEKFAEAMGKLSPNAQGFVTAALGIKPALTDAGKAVQDATFANLGTELTDVSTRVIPVLKTGMAGVAGEINGAASSFLNFLGTAQGLSGLQSVFAGATNLLHGLRSGTGDATQGMLDLVHTAEPALEGMGKAFAGIGDSIGQAFSIASRTGALSSLFTGLTQALQGVGPLLGGLVTALITIGSDVLPTLQPLFTQLGAALVAIAPALGQLGAVFANSLTALMPTLASFISALATGLTPILPVLSTLLTVIGQAVTPLIGPLSQIATTIGTALAGAIQALAPALPPIAQAFASLVNALAPLIPLIANNFSAVLQALAPALTTVFNALGPVIAQFAQQMTPVMQQIAPVLAQVAQTIGQALANALTQIAPLLPQLISAFANLVLAVVPLLPQLVNLAVQVMPTVIDIMKVLIPIVTQIIEAFTRFVFDILQKIVIPAIQWLVDQWKTMNDALSKGADFLTQTVFPAIGSAIDKVKGWFRDGVDGIKTIWDGLRDAAATPVRFLVNTVWNDGLRKAWNAVAKFLPGVGELDPVTLGFKTGGSVYGPGTGTSDSILARLSTGEHVVTAAEVLAAGGQNILYAIRDMIARGIPFTWDNGRIITDLGRDNLDAYGAAVASKGIGNVSPEGLFDRLQPRFANGGAVLPWMLQLQKGHDFAKAQSGKAYQWAGPRFTGDSFDCSGFQGSIIAAILGLNPWQRYWSTSTFAGYPQVGAQGLVKNLTNGVGMLVGITDDPGGPGGGHTAGELRPIPELGYPAARVESGGALGNVHYGTGTPVGNFASLYGLPIGANGFFQPSTGGGSVGPSTSDQHGFLNSQIRKAFSAVLDPIRKRIDTEVGPPPPEFRKIPGEMLTTFEDGSVHYLSGLADGLTDLLPSAWSKAKEVGGDVLNALNPFDSGGVATGTGFLAKNVVDPERVLSPEQTRLFDALVVSLQQLAGSGSTGTMPDLLTNSVFSQGVDTLSQLLGVQVPTRKSPEDQAQEQRTQAAIDTTGRMVADTRDLVQRTESSQETVTEQQTEQLRAVLTDISNRLTGGVLTPIMQSAFDASLGVVKDWLGSGFGLVTDAANKTTQAVNNLSGQVATTPGGNNPGAGATSPFGAPGSAFDATAEISKAVQSVAQAATSAFQQVAQQVANAALAQQNSTVSNSKGQLGKDISGGEVADLIVRLTGVEIDIRDNLINTTDAIKKMRGDQTKSFDTTGRIISDTADLMQRNQSSAELVVAEQNRINQALVKSVLRYLITSILIPIITAILSAMITLVVTAIGAAIGSIIPGVGTAIGAAIGAVVGAALAGVAAVVVSGLAVGAAAAIDSFDSGGIAVGKGYMPKDIVEPERVLSPGQTKLFDRMVASLEQGQRGNRNTTVNAPIQVVGGGPGTGAAVQNHLLALL
ncbi:hypothetical protein [Nocardia miyunensis]|uniref:hypothetical protein n=1 Tax=Nocardia miyunensis TaxID=282684 RepID=UPI00082ADB5D|nr:hypothetical protein [Nocardia miyunensis]